jgi:hypothetical protein
MTHPRDYLPVLESIGVALETTCDALMTLQSIDLLPSVDHDKRVDGHVAGAISHLRQAIDELRKAQAGGQTGLALGFVVARRLHDSTAGDGLDQSSPRRTA